MSILFPSMKHRLQLPELMDDPASDETALRATLRQFEPINRYLTRTRFLAAARFGPHVAAQGRGEVSLLDVGVGGGDFARWFSAYCRRHGVTARITAIDIDRRVLAYAREACADYPNVEVLECGAENIDRLGRRFDFVHAGHLLHHLADVDVALVLRKMYDAAKLVLLVNDVRRGRWVYVGYTLTAALLLRNSMAFEDGRTSIRRGFTRTELALAAREAGMEHATVGTLFPGRVYLCAQRGVVRS